MEYAFHSFKARITMEMVIVVSYSCFNLRVNPAIPHITPLADLLTIPHNTVLY